MIQIIKGIVVDENSDPVVNAPVEIQFSYGESQITGPGVVGRTDDNGRFAVQVHNNAAALDTCAVLLPDDSLHSFDLDPEDPTIDLGTLSAPGSGADRPRLRAVSDGIFASPEITSTPQHNYNPGSLDSVIRITSSTNIVITGLNFGVDPVDQERHILVNVGSHELQFKHQDAGSTAANRLNCIGQNSNLRICGPGERVIVTYDGAAARWVVEPEPVILQSSGPVTDGHIPVFDGTSGRILKTGGVSPEDFASAAIVEANYLNVDNLGVSADSVELGANDSGGSGFRALVVPNA